MAPEGGKAGLMDQPVTNDVWAQQQPADDEASMKIPLPVRLHSRVASAA